MAPRPLPIKTRFERYFQRTEGCWNWTGSVHKAYGYGYFGLSTHKRSEHAHRVSYRIYVGPIPDGLLVLHRCDNRRCVRPDHLFIGTQKDNIHDMIAKGRQATGDKVARKGVDNCKAKLNPSRVKIILKYKGRLPSARLATIFKVHKSTILRIWSGKYWSHL